MSFASSLSSPQCLSLFTRAQPFRADRRPATVVSVRASSADVPDFLSADWFLSKTFLSVFEFQKIDYNFKSENLILTVKRVVEFKYVNQQKKKKMT